MIRTVLLRVLLLLIAVTGPLRAEGMRADGVWTGAWETHWRGGGGQIILRQDGNAVFGEFPLYQGRITATATGSALKGQWVDGDQINPFDFLLGRDGNSFAGRNETGEWWTGHRDGAPEAPNAISQRTPRSAWRSFIVSANLAGEGQDDAWAGCVEAVDFGPAGHQMSHRLQVERVRELFDLIDLATFDDRIAPELSTASTIDLRLPQSGSDAVLTLRMQADATGAWRLVMPDEAAMAADRRALLARSKGQAAAGDAFRRVQSPRDTMRAFLRGMSGLDADGAALVLSTLDLRDVPEIVRQPEGMRAAQYLRRVLNRIGMIGLQSIPDSGADRSPYVHFIHPAGKVVIAPSGSAPDAPWQFTAESIATIDNLYAATDALPPPIAAAPGRVPPTAFFTLRERVGTVAPALLGRVGHMAYWQVLAFTVLSVLAAIAATAIARAVCAALRWMFGQRAPPALFWSMTILLGLGLLLPLVAPLGLSTTLRVVLAPIGRALACVLGGVVAWHLLRMIGRSRDSELTDAHRDDIVVSLTLAVSQFGVVLTAAISAAYFLSIPAANILAGIGLGGLAVVIASRETLANIFGAGILVADRPFRRGDWIRCGDVEGAVEHVGIWSSRVRTAQDSVMVVPNGKLTDSTINNLGKCRHRLVETELLVTAGAIPEKLQAFTDAVHRRIVGDPGFVAEKTTINVSNFTENGVVIDLNAYLKADAAGAELRSRHDLMLDILRLARQAGLKLGRGTRSASGILAEGSQSADARNGHAPDLSTALTAATRAMD